MNDDYAGICGITKEELLTQMSEDIGELAEKIGITKEQAIENSKSITMVITSLANHQTFSILTVC